MAYEAKRSLAQRQAALRRRNGDMGQKSKRTEMKEALLAQIESLPDGETKAGLMIKWLEQTRPKVRTVTHVSGKHRIEPQQPVEETEAAPPPSPEDPTEILVACAHCGDKYDLLSGHPQLCARCAAEWQAKQAAIVYCIGCGCDVARTVSGYPAPTAGSTKCAFCVVHGTAAGGQRV